MKKNKSAVLEPNAGTAASSKYSVNESDQVGIEGREKTSL